MHTYTLINIHKNIHTSMHNAANLVNQHLNNKTPFISKITKSWLPLTTWLLVLGGPLLWAQIWLSYPRHTGFFSGHVWLSVPSRLEQTQMVYTYLFGQSNPFTNKRCMSAYIKKFCLDNMVRATLQWRFLWVSYYPSYKNLLDVYQNV